MHKEKNASTSKCYEQSVYNRAIKLIRWQHPAKERGVRFACLPPVAVILRRHHTNEISLVTRAVAIVVERWEKGPAQTSDRQRIRRILNPRRTLQ